VPYAPAYLALRFFAAGAALALCEAALVHASDRELFLSTREFLIYAVFALLALPGLCIGFGFLGVLALRVLGRGVEPHGARHAARVRTTVLLLAWPLLAWLLIALSSGRRLQALSGRVPVAILIAAGVAWMIAWVIGHTVRARDDARRRRAFALVFAVIAAVALAIDMYALRRLYPALHIALASIAVAAALLSATAAPLARPRYPRHEPPWLQWFYVPLVGIMGCTVPVGLVLSDAPNARFAVNSAAPLSGKLLILFRAYSLHQQRRDTRPGARQPTAASPAPVQAGADLRGQDVLLITVDALRADCLAAYGGHGLTPQLDALARESAVFARAYTPTPHTSYALTSMLTGKFLQPLFALAVNQDGEHPTLPELLRHNGYRTAAFYPPAIFFVDQERFGAFESRQLGFEYVKAEFAPVDRQVSMVQRYLDGAEHGYPLFVWVHVFEPHEPYEPPPAFARGSSPRERYDGEVAAADAGVGALIAAFRRARPGATVIVSADHGEEHGEHGGHHHGTTLFDEQIRIPLVWSSPGRVPAQVIDTPVELVDIPTTLLSALGIPREARMRGDDLSPELAGAPAPADGRFAFSLIDSGRMATNGRFKLICGARDCQLFDLRSDSRERRDMVDALPGEVDVLRSALEQFLAATPRLEALALGNGGAWPEALTRARLGDASVAPELVPLLSSPRVDVRAEAARLLGELGVASARTVLSGLRSSDGEARVRAEAALSALRLGESDARSQVVALLAEHRDDSGLVRRAALALAAIDDASGEHELLALAADSAADEPQRLAALRALARVGGKASAAPLSELLASVRLRTEVAHTLGAIGDRRAVRALHAALQTERYPEARSAEARGLLALGARAQAVTQLRRFLGTESSLPDGVALLLEAGALARPSGAGADLRTPSGVQRGDWSCEPKGCRPLAGAEIVLPAHAAPSRGARVIVRVHVEGAARTLRIAGSIENLDGGEREIARGLAAARNLVLPVEASEGVWLQAIAVVPVAEDVPPPEPEPWEPTDGGVDSGNE